MNAKVDADVLTIGRGRTIAVVFYGGLALALLCLVTKVQQEVLPSGLASQIGHNSEALALALAVSATIQFARPTWLPKGSARVLWGLVLAVAAGWMLLAVGVYYLGLPSSIKTLNEPLLAAALLTVYLGPRRPLRGAWLVPVLTVVLVVLAFDTSLVRQQAEAVTAVVAVSISADLMVRSILLPGAKESVRTWVWCAFLAVWPALMLWLNHGDLEGPIGAAVNYQARGSEGFWGALLICLYFLMMRRAGRTTRKHD